MAVLNKIRERSIFLIVIIALALFSFVLADVIRNGGFSSQKSQSTVAVVNGDDIERQEFAAQVETFQRNMQQEMTTMQAVKQVYDSKVQEVLLQQQVDELGIQVGEKQISQLLETQLAGNPNFSDENGFFDPAVLREYVANMKATSPEAYNQWLTYENNVAEAARANIYFNMIRAGIGATLVEGKHAYEMENETMDLQYVQIPYTSVEDVEISQKEVAAYIKNHPEAYKVEASRDIQYVLFEEKPSEEDKNTVEEELTSLLEKRVEYNAVTKENDTIAGFKTTTNNAEFVNRYSDIKFQDRFFFKKDIPTDIADALFNLNEGETYGPYENNGSLNITKVIEIKQLPDSVKASHILISYKGLRTGLGLTRTQEEAKTLADSLLNVVQNDADKFGELAAEYSADNSNKDKAGDLGWAAYGMMVPAFNKYIFTHEAGDMGVVKTDFGFHIVAIQEQTDEEKAIKVATLARKIVPSEKTINDLYVTATKFQGDATENSFNEAVKADKVEARPVKGIKRLDENLPGIGPKREIVQWAFEEGTNVGDIQRFNVNGGYAVIQLTGKQTKGLMSAENATSLVSPILQKEKKAAIIKEKITGGTLSEIASNNQTTVRSATGVNLANPVISGAGNEPEVVGAAFSLETGGITSPIAGEKGVYVVKVTNRTEAPELASYATISAQETQKRVSRAIPPNGNGRIVKALKESAEIKDNRATFY